MTFDQPSFRQGFAGASAAYYNEIRDRINSTRAKFGTDAAVDNWNMPGLKSGGKAPNQVHQRIEVFPAMLLSYREQPTYPDQSLFEYAWAYAMPDPRVTEDVFGDPVYTRRGRWVARAEMGSSTVDGDDYARAAVCGAEAGNDSQIDGYQSGINIAGDDYPAGFFPQPARAGGANWPDPGTSGSWAESVAPVVPMHIQGYFDDGDPIKRYHLQYWFPGPWPHDGRCE